MNSAGAEVDIVVEAERKLVPVEVKLSATLRPEMASSIKAFHSDMGTEEGLHSSDGSRIFMKKGRLPVHGAMVRINLKNGTSAHVLIVGDSGAGKSESIEAFRVLARRHISDFSTPPP